MDDPSISKQVNIGNLADQPGWKAEIKTVEDRLELQHRLRQTELDNQWKRWKDAAFVAVLIGLGVIVWLCVLITRDTTASPDDRKWVMAVLASIVTGGIGFLAGKQSQSD